MTYEAERAQLKGAFDVAGVSLFDKITHFFRQYTANPLSEKGVPMHEVAKLGLWELGEVLYQRYAFPCSLAPLLHSLSPSSPPSPPFSLPLSLPPVIAIRGQRFVWPSFASALPPPHAPYCGTE